MQPSIRFGLLAAAALIAATVSIAPARAWRPLAQNTSVDGAYRATGVLAGRAVDGATGAPLSGARLRLVARSGPAAETTTASDGAFSFDELTAGRFTIRASAPGYLDGALGKRRARGAEVWIDVRDAERIDEATVALFRGASISGVVTDAQQRPLAGITVKVAPTREWPASSWRHGFRRTDAHGRYRFDGVVPGAYIPYVAVMRTTGRQTDPNQSSPCAPPAPPPPPGAAPAPPSILIAPRPIGTIYAHFPHNLPELTRDAGGATRTFRAVYFADAAGRNDPTPITLGSGEHRADLDFRLDAIPPASVHGALVAVSPRPIAPRTRVLLKVRVGIQEVLAGQALVADDMSFVFHDIPAGRYVLETESIASAGCDWSVRGMDAPARRDIEVPAAGLRGLTIEVNPLISVTAEFEFRGTRARPASFPISFEPLTGDDPFKPVVLNWLRDPMRAMAIDFPQPAYAIAGGGSGPWFIEGVTRGGLDLTATPLRIGTSDINDVLVTLTDRRSAVIGHVVDGREELVDDATVVVFPSDRRLWPESHHQLLRYRAARTLTGRFEFAHLVPGAYFIAALDERWMGDWPDPAFLDRVSVQATPITAEPGVQQIRLMTRP